MKECDKRKSHISSKLHIIYIDSNYVRHPAPKIFTTLHPPTRHSTSLNFSHLNFTHLHFTPLHYTCRLFTFCHLNFTQLHLTALSFGLTPFKSPASPFHLTSLHFTALLDDFLHNSIPFISPRLIIAFLNKCQQTGRPALNNNRSR